MQYPAPILGLGEEGYAFFGKVPLAVGPPNGWHGDERSAYVVDTASDIWRSPYLVPFGRERVVQVYDKNAHVGINVERVPPSMVLIGREPADQTHYTLVEQDVQERRFLLWGFQTGPRAMTGDGRHLFVNVVRRLAGM